MRFYTVLAPLQAIGDTYAPALGQPSLTASEIQQLYSKYNLTMSSSDLASELENANKYSAAGIERQIALRAGNAPGTGIRGDEGAPSLTITRPVAPPPPALVANEQDWRAQIQTSSGAPLGSVANFGPAGMLDTGYSGGPVGLVHSDPGNVVPGRVVVNYGNTGGVAPTALDAGAGGGGGGFDMTTVLLIAAMAAGAWYLLKG